MTLKELNPGQSARIDATDARQPGVVRLMVLEEPTGGDPIEVSVHGAAISIRKQQAGCFRISPIVSNG